MMKEKFFAQMKNEMCDLEYYEHSTDVFANDIEEGKEESKE
jgi:hypothetical protein